MREIRAEIYARKYVIALKSDAMFRLLERERAMTDTDDLLSNRLDDIMGVYDTQYDFPNIYYMVEDGYDSPELHESIEEMVGKAVAE